MKFRNYVFGLVILALSFYSSCTKNDEVLPQQPINCLGEAVSMLDSFSCESQLAERLSDSNICDVEYIGRYELEDDTKEFAVQYCLEIGEEVRYKNKEGDVKKFVLKDKLYYMISSHYEIAKHSICEQSENQRKLFCIETEMISYVLKEVEEELEFKISICTFPDIRDFAVGKVGDVLNISRKTNQPFYSGELSAILTKRTLSQDITYNQLFFEELELNGKMYFDVTSRDNSEDPRPLFQHFYNKEFGLIGFVDLEDTLWTLL